MRRWWRCGRREGNERTAHGEAARRALPHGLNRGKGLNTAFFAFFPDLLLDPSTVKKTDSPSLPLITSSFQRTSHTLARLHAIFSRRDRDHDSLLVPEQQGTGVVKSLPRCP